MNEYFEKQSLARAEAVLGGLELPVYAVARVLRKFHAAASFASAILETHADVLPLRMKAQKELAEFLIPLDPPEPVFDRSVWRAAEDILENLDRRTALDINGLLPALQQLFEDGRKIGSTGQVENLAQDIVNRGAKNPNPEQYPSHGRNIDGTVGGGIYRSEESAWRYRDTGE